LRHYIYFITILTYNAFNEGFSTYLKKGVTVDFATIFSKTSWAYLLSGRIRF